MSNNSPTILQRLIKKKAALGVLLLILLVALLSTFAYFIIPDKTTHANNMVVELSAKPPGYKAQLLKVPINQSLANNNINIWEQFKNGIPNNYQYLPIQSYELSDSGIKVQHIIDEGIYDTLSFNLSDLQVRQSAQIVSDNIVDKTYWLGTDRYGRDILSRLILGGRISMIVGVVTVILSIGIGILLGILAGWYQGWIDKVIMWLINILWSIPTLLLVFAITLSIGKGFWEIFIAIGLTSWVSTARLIRGQVLQIKHLDYLTAAKTLGYSDARILFKHVLPNIAGPIIVIAAANFAAAILTEASLSFLGVGVQPPTPSWGLMIKEHYNFLIAGNPSIALIPGIAIMLLVLAFNIMGNALRDIIDVR